MATLPLSQNSDNQRTADISPLGRAALHYAERGLYIFPLKPRDKKPLTKHGVKDATTDADTIRAWWLRWPDANIGLDCGRSMLVVIDLDGADGLSSWATLAVALGLNVKTRAARTGGGGLHLYFMAPQGVRIANSAGKLGPHIDVRGEGGYVVMPPSVHPNGNHYAWE